MTKKSQSKSSKKGLIIGISIGAVVAVAAAITIPLLLLNKNKSKGAKAYISLDETSAKYADLSYNGQQGDDIDISNYIGKNQFEIKFIPNDTLKQYGGVGIKLIECDKFNIDFTYEPQQEESTIKFTGKNGAVLENKDKLKAKLDSWAVNLDPISANLGEFYCGAVHGTSITVPYSISQTSAKISFVATYDDDVEYEVTAKDQYGNELNAEYEPSSMGEITITKDGTDTFVDGDEITLHFVTWTAKLDENSKKFGNLNAEGQSGKSVIIGSDIGEDTTTIDFFPSYGYESTDFDVTAKDQHGNELTATYARASGKSTIAITKTDTFVDGDEITLSLEEHTTESWTVALDPNSQNFGDLYFDEQQGKSITFEETFIGENEATINFIPENTYKWAMFTITAGNDFDVEYTPAVEYPDPIPASIKITKKNGGTFEDGDEVTLHFELQTWTASLDVDSQDLGDLSADGQTGDTVTIMEYIGDNSATISFIPGDESIDYEVTATDQDGNELEASYAKATTATITITKDDTEKFADGDEITLHFEEPVPTYTVTFYDSDGETELTTIDYTENDPTITFPENEGKEGTWYSTEYKEGLPYDPGESITFYESEFKNYDFVWDGLFHVYFYDFAGDPDPISTKDYSNKDGTVTSPAHGGGSDGVWYNEELDIECIMEDQFVIPEAKRTKNYDFVWKPNT